MNADELREDTMDRLEQIDDEFDLLWINNQVREVQLDHE